jgi:thioester reductase-like protein
VNRNIELSYLLEKESKKFHRLRRRFDEIFTNGGEHNFLKEQEQWIAPNSVRVIWQ